jgi:hypothetical protein
MLTFCQGFFLFRSFGIRRNEKIAVHCTVRLDTHVALIYTALFATFYYLPSSYRFKLRYTGICYRRLCSPDLCCQGIVGSATRMTLCIRLVRQKICFLYRIY